MLIVAPSAADRNDVQVRLRISFGAQWAGDRVVALPGHQKLFCRELGDHLATVLGDNQLLLDACRTPSVAGGPIRFERENHSLLKGFGMLKGDQPREDGLFPDG